MKKILSLILLILVFFAGNLSAQQKVTPKGRSYYFNNFSSLKDASPLKLTKKNNAASHTLRDGQSETPVGHIVLTGELFTLGKGYFIEPNWVPFYEGENGASILLRVLEEKELECSYSGSTTSGFFLNGIKDVDNGNPDYPQYILDMISWFQEDFEEYVGELIPNNDEWLETFDYTKMSGWMYFENGVMAPYGMDGYTPSDGDVMRLQFSVVGWGIDLGDTDYWGVTEDLELDSFANKDNLMKAIADVNSAENKEVLLTNESVKAAYNTAYEVTKNMTASQTLVDEAATALSKAVYAVGKVDVTITMNSTSPNITLTNTITGENIVVGENSSTPKNNSYNFKADPGVYTLSAFTTELSGSLSNGTIQITITENAIQIFEFCTITAGPTNNGWTLNTDYTINFSAISREGVVRVITPGTSATANKITFLMHIGDAYTVEYTPSEEHKENGYMTYTASATITSATANVTGSIPLGYTYSITIPQDANLFVGKKYAHYVKFSETEPFSIKEADGKKVYEFSLANSQVYNYRVSQTGKLTTAGKFTMSSTLQPLEITEEILNIDDPKRIDHDVTSNSGLNVGDIFLNINPQGHLKLNQGDEHRLMAMRTWQLSDNSTNNYFIEPDFHYTVVNENGIVDNSIVIIDENGKIKTIGSGTAIILVTYDAIYLPDNGSASRNQPYWGGPFFGAIWPENTGVFVVSVDQENSNMTTNITINESLNSETVKLAGDAVDAEHDVFYYLKDKDGYDYTFTPSGISSVTMAYPVVGETMTNYNGFSSNGVTKNQDGSYTLHLIHGRNIVKLTDSTGNSEYQVFTAKPVEYEIKNTTNPGEQFQRGDNISVVFSGLFHPANKLAGIYNMSAYIQYNGIPNGIDLILTGNQYAFGSTKTAQTASFIIPENWDITQSFTLDNGVIQVNGFGDPIGNHRNTSPDTGRNANMTAISHKTYFGSIPSVSITVNETDYYQVTFTNLPDNTDFSLSKDNKTIDPNEDGSYSISYGTYSYVAKNSSYHVLRESISISSDSPKEQTIEINMTALSANDWDGVTQTEPAVVTTEESQIMGGQFEGMEGFYKITSGYELAWFANEVNTVDVSINAVLINDIDLAGYDWFPIGKNDINSPALTFQGIFDGANYTIEGIYIIGQRSFWGFFGCIDGATIRNLSIKGNIGYEVISGTTNYYFGGLVAWGTGAFTIENCHNYVTVKGGGYTAGIIGYSGSGNFTLNNCSNHADISGSSNVGGIMGYMTSFASTASNLYNTGNITGTSSNIAGIVAQLGNANGKVKNGLNTGEVTGNTATSTASIKAAGSGSIENTYSLYEYNDKASVELTTKEELASGKTAWLLGDAFGQAIGIDQLPSLVSDKVYKVEYTTNLEWITQTIYTNDVLPQMEKDGYTFAWYNTPDGDVITEIAEDCILYILYSSIRVESMTINKENAELLIAETVQLEITINPDNALNKEVIWTSSNPSVASVDENGLVIAIATGTTTIIVISEDGRFVQRCEVKVNNSVGIDNPALTTEVYPNPLQERLFIDNKGIIMDQVIITDINGKTVYRKSVKDSQLELSVNHWTEGIYFIQITSNENTKIHKLLKK